MRNDEIRYDTSCRPIAKQWKQTRWSCFESDFGNFRQDIQLLLPLKPKLSFSANLAKAHTLTDALQVMSCESSALQRGNLEFCKDVLENQRIFSSSLFKIRLKEQGHYK